MAEMGRRNGCILPRVQSEIHSHGPARVSFFLSGTFYRLACWCKSYDSWVQETYDAYLSVRRHFYGAVQHWPNSQFWKRRQSLDSRLP